MGRTLDIKHTPVLTWNKEALDAGYRYIINQGGSRSSKTYSICQLIVLYCLQNPGKVVNIVRRTYGALNGTVMRDFFEVMKELGIYERSRHNKSEHIYKFSNGTELEYFSVDKEQKLRGRKRDLLFCNEANELSHEEFNQLMLRTTGSVIIDFNPSDTEHWIYDLLKDDKSILIKSSYKDNPFLPDDQVEYIENLINVDENWYKIYALGERPIATTRIYSHFQQFIDMPGHTDNVAYGLDFGFNHPTALVECSFLGNKVYIKQVVYESKLTSTDLIKRMEEKKIPKHATIYADGARPEIISDINRAGWTKCIGADKAVKAGIDRVKSMEVYIHHQSTDILEEHKLYSWRMYKNVILDEPVKMYDDAMDAIRYCVYNNSRKAPAVTPFYIG